MTKRSKSKQSPEKKPENSFKRGLIIAILGFIPLAAFWVYANRDEPIGGTMVTLVVAAAGAALGLWLVYRIYYNKK
jgi:hypothetical protein